MIRRCQFHPLLAWQIVGSADSSREGSYDGACYMYGSLGMHFMRTSHPSSSLSKSMMQASTDSLSNMPRLSSSESFPGNQESHLNPFSFHVAEDALALKRRSHNSYVHSLHAPPAVSHSPA